jgi:hypothetical protein
MLVFQTTKTTVTTMAVPSQHMAALVQQHERERQAQKMVHEQQMLMLQRGAPHVRNATVGEVFDF